MTLQLGQSFTFAVTVLTGFLFIQCLAVLLCPSRFESGNVLRWVRSSSILVVACEMVVFRGRDHFINLSACTHWLIREESVRLGNLLAHRRVHSGKNLLYVELVALEAAIRVWQESRLVVMVLVWLTLTRVNWAEVVLEWQVESMIIVFVYLGLYRH